MDEEDVLWAKKNWREIEELTNKYKKLIAVIPVGSTEQHGPILPLEADHHIAYKLAVKGAIAAWEHGLAVLVMPPLPYGLSEHWMLNPGTITLTPYTFMSVIEEVIYSLYSHGVKRIVIINGHGGNTHALNVAVNNAIHNIGDSDLIIVVTDWWRFINEELERILETPLYHADEGETSVYMMLEGGEPGRRLYELKCKEIPEESVWRTLKPTRYSRIRIYRYRDERAEPGCYGYPSKASPEKGAEIIRVFKEKFVELAEYLYSL